jgi:hypothetical protein
MLISAACCMTDVATCFLFVTCPDRLWGPLKHFFRRKSIGLWNDRFPTSTTSGVLLVVLNGMVIWHRNSLYHTRVHVIFIYCNQGISSWRPYIGTEDSGEIFWRVNLISHPHLVLTKSKSYCDRRSVCHFAFVSNPSCISWLDFF